MKNEDIHEFCVRSIRELNNLCFSEKPDKIPEHLKLYLELLEEEMNELEEAISLNIHKAIKKEASDVFIVKQQIEDYLKNYSITFPKELIERTSHLLKLCIFDLDLAKEKINSDEFYKCLLKVCKNNETKIPLLSEVREMYGPNWKEGACEWIEEKYKGRYYNIDAKVILDSNNDYRVVFRSDNGEGKLVKWAGYEELEIK